MGCLAHSGGLAGNLGIEGALRRLGASGADSAASIGSSWPSSGRSVNGQRLCPSLQATRRRLYWAGGTDARAYPTRSLSARCWAICCSAATGSAAGASGSIVSRLHAPTSSRPHSDSDITQGR